MADRRRRKLPSEGESEGETDENSSPTRPPRSSECESEGDMKESEVSEYESTNENRGVEEEEEEEEDDDDDEYETEEEEEVDDDDDDDDTYDGEDEDVIIEDEIDDLLDGERQSGDGQEQPDGENVDDDEDKKNPAYVPRKGAFYEHDMRITMDNQEEEDKKPKKKLWKDSEKWLHDRFNLDQQGPKSRDEIITMYGYDIRRADKPPDGPLESNRPRGRRSQQKPRLSDFVEDRTAKYVEEQNAYNSYSGMKERSYHDTEEGDYGNNRGRRGGRRGRGGRGRYNNSQEFQDRREYANNQEREFYRKDDRGYRGSAEREYERKDNRRFQDQDIGDYRNNRKNFESQNSRNDNEKFRNDRRGYQDNRQGFQSDRREGNQYEDNSQRYNQNRREGFNNRDNHSRQGYDRDRQQFNDPRPQYNERDRTQYNDPRPQYNEGRRSYENDRRRIDEGRRSYEREVESTKYRNDDYGDHRKPDFTDDRGSRGRGGFGNEERGNYRGRGRGGRDRGRDRNDRGKRREERNYPPRLQRAKQFSNQNMGFENSEDWNQEATADSIPSENRQPFPLPPSVEEKKVAPVAEIVKQEDLNIVVQNQGERKSYSKDRRARYVGKTRVQDRPSNVEEYELAKMAEKDVEQDSLDTQKNVEEEIHQLEGKTMQKNDPNQQGKPKRYSSQRQRNQPEIPYQDQVEGGANYYNPASPSFPAPPPPPRPPMLQPAMSFPQPVAGAIPSPRVFVPPQPPQSGGVSIATQVPVMTPRYNTAGVIFSPPNAPPPTFQVQPVVPITGFPPPSQVPTAVSLASPIQSGTNNQQEMIRGGTTYYAPDLQYAAPQPQKRPTGGTTYYPPEMQYKGSKRSPVRRPKAAIPIINPQDVKGKKKESNQGNITDNAPDILEPSSPLEEPTSLEDEQMQERDEVAEELGQTPLTEEDNNLETLENSDNLHPDVEIKQEPLDSLDEDSNRMIISDTDRYTICVNDDLNLDDVNDRKVDVEAHHTGSQNADLDSSNLEIGNKLVTSDSIPRDNIAEGDVVEVKTEKPEHVEVQEDKMESEIHIKTEPLDDYEAVPPSNSASMKTELVTEEKEAVRVKEEDESMEPDDFADAKETLDEEEKK